MRLLKVEGAAILTLSLRDKNFGKIKLEKLVGT